MADCNNFLVSRWIRFIDPHTSLWRELNSVPRVSWWVLLGSPGFCCVLILTMRGICCVKSTHVPWNAMVFLKHKKASVAHKSWGTGAMPWELRGWEKNEVSKYSSSRNLCLEQRDAAQNVDWVRWEVMDVEIGKEQQDSSVEHAKQVLYHWAWHLACSPSVLNPGKEVSDSESLSKRQKNEG